LVRVRSALACERSTVGGIWPDRIFRYRLPASGAGSAFGDRAFYDGDRLLRAAAARAGIHGHDAIEAMCRLDDGRRYRR